VSYETERVLIETWFQSEWKKGDGSLLTPVAYDDKDFTAPAVDVPWVRLNLLDGDALQGSVGVPGVNLKRYIGSVAIQINTKAGAGSSKARILADKVESVFNNKVLENIKFGVTYSGGAPTVAGGFSSRTIWCPFTRDEFNS
jgi:hypothetical protein